MPRALIVVENAPVPDDVRVASEAVSLAAAGWQMAVVAPRGSGQALSESRDGVRIERFPVLQGDGGAAAHLREYAGAMRSIRQRVTQLAGDRAFDLVQTCNPPDFLAGVALDARRRGTAIVFDQHDLSPELFASRFGGRHPVLKRLTRLAERAAYRIADVVLATNESIRAVAIERGGMDPADVFVVRNGPRVPFFSPVAPDPELRRGARHLLAYVGLMHRQDGVDHGLLALWHLRARRRDWRAIFLGNGEMLQSLVSLADQLGLSDCIEFRGRVEREEVRRIVSSADVCLAPDPSNELTDASTLIKVAEYMSLERPIVSFDVRESRVTAGDAAVYARDNDAREFARLIAELLDDPARRAAMGASGRRRVERKLAWEHSVPVLLAAYEHALQRAAVRMRC